jgi:hypothetical protein
MRTVKARIQLKKEIAVRESQGACNQDELFSAKPPVIK